MLSSRLVDGEWIYVVFFCSVIVGYFIGYLIGKQSKRCFICGGSFCAKCYPEAKP